MARRVEGSPYEGLAEGIVVQAAEDYRAALGKIRKNPGNREAADEALGIERFFHSAWYGMLTKVDGDFLIRRLREEAEG